MSIAGYNNLSLTFNAMAGSATSGTSTYVIAKVPYGGITVTSAYVQAVGSVAANGSNYVTFNLFNAGTSGTAQTAVGTAGGTAGVADGPVAMTLTAANTNYAADEYMSFKVGKIGSITERDFLINVQYVRGQG